MEFEIEGRKVSSYFNLFKKTANSVLMCLGWVLLNSKSFFSLFLQSIDEKIAIKDCKIKFDFVQSAFDKKFLKVVANDFSFEINIVASEKNDCNLGVLKTMSQSFCKISSNKYLVVLIKNDMQTFAFNDCQNSVVKIKKLSLSKILDTVNKIVFSTYAEKKLLIEFRSYIGDLINMKNDFSNEVFCVSVCNKHIEWDKNKQLTTKNLACEHNIFYHPIGGKWPSEPVNYLALRCHGQLLAIYYVKDYKIVNNAKDICDEFEDRCIKPHFVYSLGLPIIPNKKVTTKGVDNDVKRFVFLDLLLTESSLKECFEKSDEREKNIF